MPREGGHRGKGGKWKKKSKQPKHSLTQVKKLIRFQVHDKQNF